MHLKKCLLILKLNTCIHCGFENYIFIADSHTFLYYFAYDLYEYILQKTINQREN